MSEYVELKLKDFPRRPPRDVYMKMVPPEKFVFPDFPGKGDSYGWFTWRVGNKETVVTVNDRGFVDLQPDDSDLRYELWWLLDGGTRMSRGAHPEICCAERVYGRFKYNECDVSELHLVNYEFLDTLRPEGNDIW